MIAVFLLGSLGFALEAFRLSVAAGAIQANLPKRKMIWLGIIFAAIQFFLFSLGIGLLLQCGKWLMAGYQMDFVRKIGSVIFFLLGCVYIWYGAREKRLEECCASPWSAESFAKYAWKHGLMFFCAGCAFAFYLKKVPWHLIENYLFLFMASVMGLAYGYWMGSIGCRRIRFITGCIWMIVAACLWFS